MKPRIATRPMRVVRPADLDGVYTNPRAVLAKQARSGKVHRVARGVFVAVPDDAYDPHRWRPAFEAAAGAVGTALVGERAAVAMGMTAARLHGAVPRARARAELAVRARRRPVDLTDRPAGTVEFRVRDVDALDVQTVQTELGPMLTTTPEQTVVDLAAGHPEAPDVHAAMTVLARRVDWDMVERLATERRRPARTLRALKELRRQVVAA